MTFSKYLVILGFLACGWSAARAADSTPGNAPESSASDAAATGEPPPTTHHRKHHHSTAKSTDEATSTTSAKDKAADNTPVKQAETKSAAASTSLPDKGKKPVDGSAASSGTASSHHKGKTDEADSADKTPTKKSSAKKTAKNGRTSGPSTGTNASADQVSADKKTGTAGEKSAAGKQASTAQSEAETSAHHHAKPGEATSGTENSTSGKSETTTENEPDTSRHHHKSGATMATGGTTAGSTGTGKTSVTATTEGNATAPTATTPAKTAPATPSSTAGSTHHRHHHDKLPTIVVTPSAIPLPQQVGPPPLGPAVVGPTVETGLPVARPGAGTTATLPLVGHPTLPASVAKFPFTDFTAPIPHRATRTYPWKNGIITTVFWIGEGSSGLSSMTNIQSAWDTNWIRHNGGTDDPDDMSTRSGYSSLTHASTLNPFYVALPFNDLAYPEKAQRWLPPGWYKPPRHGQKPVSACQGRWIEIKNRAGRVCYAQWEDVGPLVSDHAEYVFGPERPDTLTRAGLDVSPAVAKYLGFESTAITSWRFVDDDDVEPGMWLRYDEQAILFQALEEQIHPHKTPRLQDLSEPLPDGSAQDGSEKRSGAARG